MISSSSRIGDRAFAYRRKVVRIYVGLRLLFLAASLLALILLQQGYLQLEGASALRPLWQAFAVFAGWSLLLLAAIWIADRRSALRIEDRLIFVSLFLDGFAIYLAAAATGGAKSPFFHSVYFLI